MYEQEIEQLNQELKQIIVRRYCEIIREKWDDFDEVTEQMDAEIFKETVNPNTIDLSECWQQALNQVDFAD